jgi:hypothetical protein
MAPEELEDRAQKEFDIADGIVMETDDGSVRFTTGEVMPWLFFLKGREGYFSESGRKW